MQTARAQRTDYTYGRGCFKDMGICFCSWKKRKKKKKRKIDDVWERPLAPGARGRWQKARAEICIISPLSSPLPFSPSLLARLALFFHFRVEGGRSESLSLPNAQSAPSRKKLFTLYYTECTYSLHEGESRLVSEPECAHTYYPLTQEPVTITTRHCVRGTACRFSSRKRLFRRLLVSDKAVFGSDILPGCCAPARAVNHERDGCVRARGAAAPYLSPSSSQSYSLKLAGVIWTRQLLKCNMSYKNDLKL